MDTRRRMGVEEGLQGQQVLAVGLAQLLVCDESRRWREVGCVVTALHVNNGAASVSLFRANDCGLEATFDLYPELDYIEQSAFLHCFEVEDGMLGLNFASSGEARVFSTNVKGFLVLQSRSPRSSEAPPVPPVAKRSGSPRPGNASDSSDMLPSVSPRTRKAPPIPGSSSGGTHSATSSPQVQRHSPRQDLNSSATLTQRVSPRQDLNSSTTGKKGGGAILSFFKSFGSKGKSDHGSRPVEDIMISAPESFEHRSHIGWDAQNGFDAANLPQEWKVLFKNAGLKKKDLEDEETAKFVLGHIADQLSKAEGSKVDVVAHSPPAVPRRGNGPPPPVPSVTTRRTGTLGANTPAPHIVLAPASPPAATRSNRDSIPVPSSEAPPPPPVGNRRAPVVPSKAAPAAELSPQQTEEVAAKREPVNKLVSTVQQPPPPPPPPPVAPPFDESFYGPAAPPPPPADAVPSPRASPRVAGQSSLVDQLGTVKLKKVEEMQKGALPKLDQKTSEGLAGSLAMALANRRGAIAPTASHDAESDDDWSD
jgi:Wiskott-Aldrich syndrome protein